MDRILNGLGNGVLLVLVLAFGLLAGWGVVKATVADPCNLYVLQLASDSMKNVVFSCEEFWVNRYQGLIGNVFTGTVAFLSIRLIIGQLTAANRQASVAASQALRVKIMDLEKESGVFSDKLGKINKFRLEGYFSDFTITAWPQASSIHAHHRVARLISREANIVASDLIAVGAARRLHYLEKIKFIEIPEYADELASLRPKIAYFHGGEEPESLKIASDIYTKIKDSVALIEATYQDLYLDVTEEIRLTWKRVGEFDADALR